MQKQRAFIRASSSSIPYLHRRSGEIPGRERVSKAQRFYWGLGAVGEVMAMASADWLGKGPSPVRQVRGGGGRLWPVSLPNAPSSINMHLEGVHVLLSTAPSTKQTSNN